MDNHVISPAEKKQSLQRQMGLLGVIAMGVGNTIGSGLFFIPQNLAAASTPLASLIAFVVSAFGCIIVAFSFANLSQKMPLSGGTIVYVKKAEGSFAAFLVGWYNWFAGPSSIAGLVVGMVAYLGVFFPVLLVNNVAALIVCLILYWFIVLINIRGVKSASAFNIITTVVKVIPIILFVLIAATKFDFANLTTVNPAMVQDGASQFATIPAGLAVTMWCFMGFDTIAQSAGVVKDPEKNIKRGTILSILFVTIVYVLVIFVAYGVMDQEMLAGTSAPFSEILQYCTGSNVWSYVMSIFIMFSIYGCASGTLLAAAQFSYGMGEQKIFPPIFAKLHPKYNTPITALIIEGIFGSLLIIANYTKGLAGAYLFIILVSTMSTIICFIATVLSDIMLLRDMGGKVTPWRYIKKCALPLLAFVYLLYAIYGTGYESVMWGFLFLLVGLPVYAYMRYKYPQSIVKSGEPAADEDVH